MSYIIKYLCCISIVALFIFNCSNKDKKKTSHPKKQSVSTTSSVVKMKITSTVFSSSSRIIRFESEDTLLEGSFDYPVCDEKVPSILLIHGWGDIDRRGNSYEWGEIENFTHFAKVFTKHGIAVFRWDKRGVKKSEGNKYDYKQKKSFLLKDILNAYKIMLKQKEVDRNFPFLLGQSQGSAFIASIFDQIKDIATPKGVILLSNVIDKHRAFKIKAPILALNGVYDWNNFITFCKEPVKAHRNKYGFNSLYFLAPDSDHGVFNMKLGKGVVRHGKDGPYITHPQVVEAMLYFVLTNSNRHSPFKIKVREQDGMIYGSSEEALQHPYRFLGKRNQHGWIKDQPPKEIHSDNDVTAY